MQNREPPAFLVYAAAVLAARPFKLQTASERGIDYSMRLECWVNLSVPAEPGALAVVLGLDAAEVAAALPAVMANFAYVGEEIVCPELDRYREHLLARHLKLSEGGSRGAALTNGAKKKPRARKNGVDKRIAGDAACLSATPSASVQPLNATQPNPNQSNPPVAKGLVVDPFPDSVPYCNRTGAKFQPRDRS